MHIKKIAVNKKQYLDLLLLGDEQESMIDRYLNQGDLFVLEEERVLAVCVVTREAPGVYEVKNIAVSPQVQGRGYGKQMMAYAWNQYSDCREMIVGTGESPGIIAFYEACGFSRSHRVTNFFLQHYDHPIFEEGRRLIDMIYLKKEKE